MNRREFIKIGAAAAIGVGVASAIEIPLLENSIGNDNNKVKQLQSQVTQGQLAFLTLNPDEQSLVEAVAEVMIPTDENGPGAKEAGVVYFIDRQLASGYGKNSGMYLSGPFVLPNLTSPITVDGTTYSAGSAPARIRAGTGYQYSMTLREFWRTGLSFLQQYSKSSYGNPFEILTSDQKIQVLKDLWNNKPTNFTGPNPQEFFSEMYDLVTAGFFSDPIYGGNKAMVGWILQGSNGVNMGTAQGYSTIQLATASSPTRLPPMSLGQLQNGGNM